MSEAHINNNGTPTAAGLRNIAKIAATLNAIIVGHDDNTGARCRIDLIDHDCCYTCNEASEYLAKIRECDS